MSDVAKALEHTGPQIDEDEFDVPMPEDKQTAMEAITGRSQPTQQGKDHAYFLNKISMLKLVNNGLIE